MSSRLYLNIQETQAPQALILPTRLIIVDLFLIWFDHTLKNLALGAYRDTVEIQVQAEYLCRLPSKRYPLNPSLKT